MTENSMEQTEVLVVDWARERGIYRESGTKDQMMKLVEELGELSRALVSFDDHGIEDGIGDCMVVLTNIAHMCGKKLGQCYSTAYNEIKPRHGEMINGTFVKDSVL